MLDKQTQFAKKMVLSITRSSQSSNDHDLLEIIHGVLYDALQACYGLAPEWNLFVHGGQFEIGDETIKAQIASIQDTEAPENTALWAMRIQIRDSVNKRRTWWVQIGIREENPNLLKLYYVLTYYDHLAGSFSLPRPLIINIQEPIDVSGVKSLGRQKLTAVCTKIHAYLSLSGEIIVHSVRRYC